MPDGVVNVVPTTDAAGVVTTWLQDARVRKISFTGSTGVGRVLLRQAADRIVNSSMELGGNAPFIVTEDADLDAAVAGAMIAKFRNGGQACTAANRFYVHADVIDEFTARFGTAVEALTVGPASTGAEIGPLISQRAVENVDALVRDAVAAGARISHRAAVAESKGWFYPPTVLVGRPPPTPPSSSQEIFGPVAPIVAWNDDDELIDLVNASEMGLAAYVLRRTSCSAPCASARRSTPAWSASTGAWYRTRRHRSAASSRAASAAKAPDADSRSSRKPNTSASTGRLAGRRPCLQRQS